MRAIHQASSEPAAKLAKGPVRIEAEPYEFVLLPEHCALVIIDMQRDFLEPGGFGEMFGNDVSQLRRTIQPNKRLDGRPDSSSRPNAPLIPARDGVCRSTGTVLAF